jgi:hypothetical protein
VLDCAEPFEGDTLVWPLSVELVLLESLLLESPLLDVPALPVLPFPVFVVVDELSVLSVVDVSREDSVASRAAKPKPAVAAIAVTASPAVTAAARRLPCSRDVIAPPLMASTEHRGRLWEVAVDAAGVACGLPLAPPQQTRSDCPRGLQACVASSGHGHRRAGST